MISKIKIYKLIHKNASYALALCLRIGLLTSSASAREPPITALAFAPDGNSLVAGSQAGLRVYGWPDLDPRRRIETTAGNIHDLAFSPIGDRLAVGGGSPGESGVVEILSWPEGRPLRILGAHADSVLAVAWQGPSTVASASLDRGIVVWDSGTGDPIGRLSGHSRGVSALGFLAAGDILVSAGVDQSLRVWDWKSGQLARSLNLHTGTVNHLAPRPAAGGLPMIASVSDDRTARFWQPTIGRMVRFARLGAKPLDAGWLVDGSLLAASCADGHVRLIDPDTVEVVMDVPAVDGRAYSLAVHPTDGHLLIGGEDGQLRRVKLNVERREPGPRSSSGLPPLELNRSVR